MTKRSKRLALIFAIVMGLVLVVLACEAYLAQIPVAVVQGNSMLPLLGEGDVVFILKAYPNEIREGDIIVFWAPGKTHLIIHRVIKVIQGHGNTYYITKGDNNPFPDSGIAYDEVVGKVLSINGVTFKIPYVGHLTLIFREVWRQLASSFSSYVFLTSLRSM